MSKREKTKQLWQDPEWRERQMQLPQRRTGRKLSEEHKQKIGAAHKGRKRSDETRQKMSAAMRGNKNGVGKPSYWTGKKRSELCPISDATKQRLSDERRGEKNPNWKGGSTPLNKSYRKTGAFRAWRDAVFARDDWTCQRCSQRGGNLHPHHILNFAEWIELRFLTDNGITLCVNCHDLFHKTFGFSKNNQFQLAEFLERASVNTAANVA